jgi:hypothetical protein
MLNQCDILHMLKVHILSQDLVWSKKKKTLDYLRSFSF